MYNAQKRYIKENIKKITLNYKNDDYTKINSIAIDNNIKISSMCRAMINYCIKNNISIEDLKKYI